MYILKIEDLEIEIVKKKIKNAHIYIYPPDGRVRVTAPERIGNSQLLDMLTSRMSWIRENKLKYICAPKRQEMRYVSGDMIPVWGRDLVLEVCENQTTNSIVIDGDKMRLNVTLKVQECGQRKKIIYEWYRRELKTEILQIGAEWEDIIGVKAREWRVKDMKTRWGTCNVRDERIWINLQLAKMDRECLEYVIVHELVHLLERSHNHIFRAYMDKYMPDWRNRRKRLKMQYQG